MKAITVTPFARSSVEVYKIRFTNDLKNTISNLRTHNLESLLFCYKNVKQVGADFLSKNSLSSHKNKPKI